MKKIRNKVKLVQRLLNNQKKTLKRIKKKRSKGRTSFFLNQVSLNKEQKFKEKRDLFLIHKFDFKLNRFLEEKGNIVNKSIPNNIMVPVDFSLDKNYDKSIETITTIRKSIMENLGKTIYIDFSQCNFIDFSVLFLMKVVIEAYLIEISKLESRLTLYSVLPNIQIKVSKNSEVNNRLVANEIINNKDIEDSKFIPKSLLNLIKGRKSQKRYNENKKGKTVTSLRNYINDEIRAHQFELNAEGIRYFDGLLSEILNNAEDHSPFDEWYAFANIFATQNIENQENYISEINLAIFNFGYSIYEGFENTKTENIEMYTELDSLAESIRKKEGGEKFTKENLFTLYALQPGKSRLKFEDPSRGTGTMKFILSFLRLGDFENNQDGFVPKMSIFSGHTHLVCDNKYHPKEVDGIYYLALNSQNSLSLPPEMSHLRTLNSIFPGTLLTARIYLNQNHLTLKINNNGKPND